MNKLVSSVFALVLTAAGCSGSEFPDWAYPVPPPNPPATAEPPPNLGPRHVPNSTAVFTATDLKAHSSVIADWHPEEHPAMPDIVNRGREPQVWACAFCHLPSGAGRPENASLAGLTPAYIKQQIIGFKNGDRPGAEPKRAPQNLMIALAKQLTDAEIDIAAHYFSAVKPESFVKVIESATVPKTHVAGAMLGKNPGSDTEPLGERMIEFPEELARAENRDSRTPYEVYVPVGSIARGQALVTQLNDGKTIMCTTCHGPALKGLGDVPRLAGRSPSYLFRQLFDIKSGARNGSAALMKPVVANLTTDDMIAIVAYLASREP